MRTSHRRPPWGALRGSSARLWEQRRTTDARYVRPVGTFPLDAFLQTQNGARVRRVVARRSPPPGSGFHVLPSLPSRGLRPVPNPTLQPLPPGLTGEIQDPVRWAKALYERHRDGIIL